MANNNPGDKPNDKKTNSGSSTQSEKTSDKSSDRLSDTIKKILTAGSPTDISKELVQTVVGNVLKTKDDITMKATNEMIALIRRIDFVQEFSKFAQDHKFKVSAEIEILKKDDPKKPSGSQS